MAAIHNGYSYSFQNNTIPDDLKTPPALSVTPPSPTQSRTFQELNKSLPAPKETPRSKRKAKKEKKLNLSGSHVVRKESSELEEEGTASEYQEQENITSKATSNCIQHDTYATLPWSLMFS